MGLREGGGRREGRTEEKPRRGGRRAVRRASDRRGLRCSEPPAAGAQRGGAH